MTRARRTAANTSADPVRSRPQHGREAAPMRGGISPETEAHEIPANPAVRPPQGAMTARFGEVATDPQLTEGECGDLGYPAGTEWTAFADDELARFVKYLYDGIGASEYMIYVVGQFGDPTFTIRAFVFERLDAIEAHRGAQWLDPIVNRLREKWQTCIDRGMAFNELAEEFAEKAEVRARTIFPDNPAACEALGEIMDVEWRRVHGLEVMTETEAAEPPPPPP